MPKYIGQVEIEVEAENEEIASEFIWQVLDDIPMDNPDPDDDLRVTRVKLVRVD